MGLRTMTASLALVFGCYASHEGARDGGSPEAPDADEGPRFEPHECDDPRLWSLAPARPAQVEVRGRDCRGEDDHPISPFYLALYARSNPGLASRLSTSCWRVADASPLSGWTVGDTYRMEGGFFTPRIRAGAPVSFEVRAIDEEGRLYQGRAEVAVRELPPPRNVDGLVALGPSEDGVLATRDAFFPFADDPVPSAGVIESAAGLSWIERVAGRAILSRWQPDASPLSTDLGMGTFEVLGEDDEVVAVLEGNEVTSFLREDLRARNTFSIPEGYGEFVTGFGTLLVRVGRRLEAFHLDGVPLEVRVDGVDDLALTRRYDGVAAARSGSTLLILRENEGVISGESSAVSMSLEEIDTLGDLLRADGSNQQRAWFRGGLLEASGVAGPRVALLDTPVLAALQSNRFEWDFFAVERADGSAEVFRATLDCPGE